MEKLMQFGSMATSDQSSAMALPVIAATPAAAGATATIADPGFQAAVRLAIAAPPPPAALPPRPVAPLARTTDIGAVVILNALMPLPPTLVETASGQPPPLSEPALPLSRAALIAGHLPAGIATGLDEQDRADAPDAQSEPLATVSPSIEIASLPPVQHVIDSRPALVQPPEVPPAPPETVPVATAKPMPPPRAAPVLPGEPTAQPLDSAAQPGKPAAKTTDLRYETAKTAPSTANNGLFPARQAAMVAPETEPHGPSTDGSAHAVTVAAPTATAGETVATGLPPPPDRSTAAPAKPPALDQPSLVTVSPVATSLSMTATDSTPASKRGLESRDELAQSTPQTEDGKATPPAATIEPVALEPGAPLFLPAAPVAAAEGRSDAAVAARSAAVTAGNTVATPSPAALAGVAPATELLLNAAPESILPPEKAGVEPRLTIARPSASVMPGRPRPAPEAAAPAAMPAASAGLAPLYPAAPPPLQPRTTVATAVPHSPATTPPLIAATPASAPPTRTEAVDAAAPLFAQPPVPVALADPARVPSPVRLATAPAALAHDLGLAIARQIAADGNTLHVRIDPAELGRIDVRMAFDDKGILRAVVAADSSLSLDLLRRDSADLGRAMTDVGVRADGQSFRFEGRSDGRGADFGRNRSAPPRDIPAETDPITPETPNPTRFRPLRWRGQVDVLA